MRRFVLVLGLTAALLGMVSFGAAPVSAGLPASFKDSVVFSGLNRPVAIRFASDGRVFVMEKAGFIQEYDNLADTTPTTVYQFNDSVHDFWDRGPLGLALDPNFPANPYIYILYAHDGASDPYPHWTDTCPTPPGPTTDGCTITSRLSRLTISGNTATNEQVLLSGWCQQYPSHSTGDLYFGADGALYVSGGDGASFGFADYGQGGGTVPTGGPYPTPKNPCGDPPGTVGSSLTPPTAEGGALRSQSVRRAAGESAVLSGALLRVNPATGAALPDNPLVASSDPIRQRIVGYGFRNPFRFTIRPGTNDVWIGDVGWNDWEEINRQPSPTTSALNFGWPCYEGNNPMPGYQALNVNLCASLYSAGTATPPYYTYNHSASVVANDGCLTASGSSVTGLAFYNGGSYPASYNGALFFGDYSRQCIWVMKTGSNGLPDPSQIQVFDQGQGEGPVDLEIGPGGDLFYADMAGGTIRRITYTGGNNPPTANATASPTSGTAPLTVNFDASGSSDPDSGDTITYSWDLNGDGTYGDSTAKKPSYTYNSAGTYTVRLQVTDNHGSSTTSSPITINAVSGSTSTFGTTTIGASTDTASVDLKEVSKYTASQAVSVLKLTGYISGLGAGSGSQPVRAVMYADSGGNPGALLGVSNQVTVTAGQAWGWVDFTFPSAVSVSAGTVWMGYIGGTANDLTQLRFDNLTGDLRYNSNPGGYSGGPSNPFGSAITTNKHYSLYATFGSGGGGGNTPPTAVATASPTSGTAPLAVTFDGSGSSDPDAGDTISYSWDLNGDGTYGDATGAKPAAYTYAAGGTYTARLQVTDNHGASTISSPITITVTTGGGTGGTVGTTTIGALADTASQDFKEVSKYTSVQAGSLTKLTGYISGLGAASGSQPIRGVVYADNGGSPGALIGVSNQVTIAAGRAWGWVDFTFPSAVSIPTGTIWMGYIGGAVNDLTQLRYDTLAGDLRYNFNTGGYAAGATNPYGSATSSNKHYSLYGTYTSSGNAPPVPTISTPLSSLTYAVGDPISFSGSATDPEDGTLAAAKLSWTLLIHHCPSGLACHIHNQQTWSGVASGSFGAPDHDYPSYIELTLTATDSQGLSATTSVLLQPKTVNLTFASSPTGLQLTLGSTTSTAPFTATVIAGSANSVSAAASQTLGNTTYSFTSWSDGGAQSHNLTAPTTNTTYTATYTKTSSVFGTTTIGASTDAASQDFKEVSKYTASAGGVTKLTGYISGLGAASGTQSLRAVIYANNGGVPGALLGVSNAVTVNAGAAWSWVDFTFPSTVTVSAGTIWMGYIGSGANDLAQLRCDIVTGDLRYNANTGGYAAGPTNPFGTGITSNKHYSLYATYH